MSALNYSKRHLVLKMDFKVGCTFCAFFLVMYFSFVLAIFSCLFVFLFVLKQKVEFISILSMLTPPLSSAGHTCNFAPRCRERTGRTGRIQSFLPSRSPRSSVCRTADLSAWRQIHFLTSVHWQVLRIPDNTQKEVI